MGQTSVSTGRAQSGGAPAELDPSLIKSRALLPNGDEFLCLARNVTVRSADLLAKVRIEIGQPMVLHLDEIGLLHATVTEVLGQGFVVSLTVAAHRRDRIAAQLAWYAGRASRRTELRGAPRIVPLHRQIEVRLGKTMVYDGTILNISMSGAAIALDADEVPFVGARLRVGTRYAKVVRLIPEGIAVEFEEAFTPGTFDQSVRL